jgi:hypothetical protein
MPDGDKPILYRKRPGQPPKLLPTKETLERIKGLGRIMATTRECAAFFDVDHGTFLNFCKRHTIVKEILEDGAAVTRMSLRRKQIDKALEGNATMLIWTGKQYLDQHDRMEHTGKDGGAIKSEHNERITIDLESMTDEQLHALRPVLLEVGQSAADGRANRPNLIEAEGRSGEV